MAQARTARSGGSAQEGRIGSGARVRGKIAGEGDLTVDGQVEGDIALRGDLTVSASGSVEAESIEADSLTIAGTVQGDVRVTGQVRALAGARLRGDVRGAGIAIDEGAHFSGRIDCDFDLPPELGGEGARAGKRRG